MILRMPFGSEDPASYRRIPEIFACKMRFMKIFIVLANFFQNFGVQAKSRKERRKAGTLENNLSNSYKGPRLQMNRTPEPSQNF